MLYSISEASKALNTSRVTIYAKIKNLKELHPHVKVKNKTQYITPEGIEIIRKSMELNQSKYFIHRREPEKESNDVDVSTDDFTILQADLIQTLKEQIKDLQKDKDKLFIELEQQRLLHKNTQIILQQMQAKVIALENMKNDEEEESEIQNKEEVYSEKISLFTKFRNKFFNQ